MKSMKKPPMGWNSYDYYDTTVTEDEIKQNATIMSKYLKPFGWEYIVVDIEWYAYGAGSRRDEHQYIPFSKLEMDEYSRLLPCPERFPSSANGKGFAPLAEYIHNLGLKFGIHIMRGIPRCAAHSHTKIYGSPLTADEIADPYSICNWNPDMYGVRPDKPESQQYYNSLMNLYAEWGVDFVKCDDICRMDAESSKQEIIMLHKSIQQCGRDIALSLSPGPALVEEAEFYHENANMWRITDDFWDNWDSLLNMFERCRTWQGLNRAGGYADCDMLALGQLGKGFGEERTTRFTKQEQKTMMSLWCVTGSPLMIGANLTKLDSWTLNLLTNQEVLSLLWNTKDAHEISYDDKIVHWESKSLDDSYTIQAIFNISDEQITIPLSHYVNPADTLTTELWKKTTLNREESITLLPHDVMLLKNDK